MSRFFSSKRMPRTRDELMTSGVTQLEPPSIHKSHVQPLHSPSSPVDLDEHGFLGLGSNSGNGGNGAYLRNSPPERSHIHMQNQGSSHRHSTTYYTWSDSDAKSKGRRNQRERSTSEVRRPPPVVVRKSSSQGQNSSHFLKGTYGDHAQHQSKHQRSHNDPSNSEGRRTVPVVVSETSGQGQGLSHISKAAYGKHAQHHPALVDHDTLSENTVVLTSWNGSGHDREPNPHRAVTPKPGYLFQNTLRDVDRGHVSQNRTIEKPVCQLKPLESNADLKPPLNDGYLSYQGKRDSINERGPEAFDQAFIRLWEKCKFKPNTTSRDMRLSYSRSPKTPKIPETGDRLDFEPMCSVPPELSQDAKAQATRDEPRILSCLRGISEPSAYQPQCSERAEGRPSTADGYRYHPASVLGHLTSINSIWHDYPNIYEGQVIPVPLNNGNGNASTSFGRGFPRVYIESSDMGGGFDCSKSLDGLDQGQGELREASEPLQWHTPLEGSSGISIDSRTHQQIATEPPPGLHDEHGELETSGDPTNFWRPQRLY